MNVAANPVVSVIVALTLALTAAAVAAPAPAATVPERSDTVSRIEALREVVKAELDSENYIYEYVDADKAFYYDVMLSGTINSASVRINLYGDMITFQCTPRITVKEEYRELMAELQCRVNWTRSFAQLQMNDETGEISSYGYLLVDEVLPGVEEVSVRRFFTVDLLEEFGDALAKVALLGVAPKDALPENYENADVRTL